MIHHTANSECNLESQLRAASGIFEKGHFGCSFTLKYLKITLFLEKGIFLSNITVDSICLPDADFFWIIPCNSNGYFSLSLDLPRSVELRFMRLGKSPPHEVWWP